MVGFLVDWLIGAMLFHPSPGIDLDPARFGIETTEVHVETEDGVRVHAFWLESPGADRTILFLHGNAGNASHRLPNAELLRRLGANVLLLDYRGYGMSDGRPSVAGIEADGRAGLRHLTGTLGIPEERIVIFGRSLGGAVAVYVAQDRDLAGVILESTFSSLSDAAGRHFGGPGAWLVEGRLDSAARIERVRAPLLFIHGDRDDIVPHELGRNLYDAASDPKRFETLRGAGHNDTVEVGGRGYAELIRAFLDEVAP